jgi:hypothetical protein
MWNIKLRPSKLIISSDAQKHMVGLDFERKYHDLKYFEVGIFFFIFLEIIMYLRSSSL